MPISTNAGGSVRVTGKPRKRIPLSATISALVSRIAIKVPEGVTHLEFVAPRRRPEIIPVTPGTTYIHTYTRDPIGPREHPHQIVSVAAQGFRSNPLRLRFVRDAIAPAPVPVTLVTPAALSAGTTYGTALTATPAVFGGDVLERQNYFATSSAATYPGAFVPTANLWTTIAGVVGTYFIYVSRARGPNGWVESVTTPRLIAARPAEAALTTAQLVVERSVNLPDGQTATRSPIVQTLDTINGKIFALEYTAAAVGAVSPTWNPVTPRNGETKRWNLGDADTSDEISPHLFGAGDPRENRLRFRWKQYEDQDWSPASALYTVPAVVSTDPTADFTVANRTELLAAMTSAVSGQVIAMQPGDYTGTISFRNRNKGNPGITIRPVDRTNPPVILNGTIDVEGSTGIEFDGLISRMTIKDTNPTYYGAGPYLYPANNSMGGFNGANVEDSTRITFRNCVFDGHHIAINGAFTVGLVIDYCHITGCGMDSIRCYNTNDGFTLRNTLFDGPNVDLVRATADNADGDARHPDFLQFANSKAMNWSGNSNFLIENNAFYATYGYHQSIFLYNEKCREGGGTLDANGHKNGVIRGNYIESRHQHAITLSGHKDVLVENNLIRSKPGSPTAAQSRGAVNPPQIVQTPTTSGANSTGIIRNNVQPPKDSLGHNDIDRITRSGTTNSQDGLIRTGNRRSNTEVPAGWVMPKVGPYAYLS